MPLAPGLQQVKSWARSRLTQCKKDREPPGPGVERALSRATALSRVLENRIPGMFGRKSNNRGTSGHGQPLN
jgi:hypothetical protein